MDGFASIKQIQLLSHQSKISRRVELFVGTGEDYLTCNFTRLGYLALDNNEASGYKARELKSVYVQTRGNFVKLVLHQCYVNAPNIFNQVGVVAINVTGAPLSAQQQQQQQGYALGEQHQYAAARR